MDLSGALAVLEAGLQRRSQNDLARELDVSEATMSRWLSRDASPTGRRLRRLIEWAEAQSGRVREASPPYDANPITALVREGQTEQAVWLQDFVARVLEAQAAMVRSMVLSSNATGAELEAATLRQQLLDRATGREPENGND